MAMSRIAKLWLLRRALSSKATSESVAASFSDPVVQDYLMKITGLDLDRVFKARKQVLSVPSYKLLTEKQLDKLHEDTIRRAKELLVMPPVLPEREERGQVIETDARLEGFDDHKWVFVDISMGKEDKDRYVVVRETDGTLRDSTWEERDRVVQMYCPKPGRSHWLPKLLTEEELPRMLLQGEHLHVLDLVCVQCPPDSKDFIRVHHTVYNHIDRNNLHQMLYSTRHFGGLVWYLLRTKSSLDGLVESLLNNKQLEEAESLVNLYVYCWPESSFVSSLNQLATPSTGLKLIKLFCAHNGYSNAESIVSEIIDGGSAEVEENITAANH